MFDMRYEVNKTETTPYLSGWGLARAFTLITLMDYRKEQA